MVEIEDFGKSIITVIIGVDGSVPNREILIDIQELVNDSINRSLEFDPRRDSVSVNVDEHPLDEEVTILGPHTIYLMRFDISLKGDVVNQGIVNAAHNVVVDIVSDHGFTITGTTTVWNSDYQT